MLSFFLEPLHSPPWHLCSRPWPNTGFNHGGFKKTLNWTPFQNPRRMEQGGACLFKFTQVDSNCAVRAENHTTPSPLKISSTWIAMVPNIGCWVDLPGRIFFFLRKISMPTPYLRSVQKKLRSGAPHQFWFQALQEMPMHKKGWEPVTEIQISQICEYLPKATYSLAIIWTW